MKAIIRIIAFFPIIFLFTSCDNTESPTGAVSFIRGEYTGTFSVTFKNYRNTASPLTQEGTISIMFSDSTYKYSAKADFSSNGLADTLLTDGGRFTRNENKIIMNDFSWMTMDAWWHNSLYLLDTFTVRAIGNQFEISQDNSFANWQINLTFINE
ncbi:MAG: hypothetical protein IT279_08850 [Ignavibacteriaceae bacterium]|nr:hypothetical protein [Ignavibacteriaceae bacterium]